MDGRVKMIEALDESVSFYIKYRQVFEAFENKFVTQMSYVITPSFQLLILALVSFLFPAIHLLH